METENMVASTATEKITVTIPEELLEEVRGRAGERGISAYVTEALELRRSRERLAELVDRLEEEYGPLTVEETEAGRRVPAEIDEEHRLRRGDSVEGEAAWARVGVPGPLRSSSSIPSPCRGPSAAIGA
jgi:hypothetical protein